MGRRGDHGLEKIREMAIEAAEAIVAEGGLNQLSTRKVAARIGYTAGTLYLVFEDFKHLLLEVNGRSLDLLFKNLEDASQSKTDHVEAIYAICRAYLAFSRDNSARWTLLFERQWGPGFERPEWYQNKKKNCFKPLAARLGALGIAESEDQLVSYTRTLWASIHGTCVLAEDDKLTQAGASDSTRELDLQVELFLKALLGPKT